MKRILIVEDETWIAMDLHRILVDGGYDVVGLAADRDSAVRLSGELAPTLVLMDIRLSGPGDGIEAAAQILERFGIRSVFLSGHLDPETRHRLQTARPLAVLDKPVAPAALLRAIAAAV